MSWDAEIVAKFIAIFIANMCFCIAKNADSLPFYSF